MKVILKEEDMLQNELVSLDREKLGGMRWEVKRTEAYMEKLGVIKGCNYVPAYCYSYIQMWFDFRRRDIERELDWARKIGINSLRIFVPMFAYQDEDLWSTLTARLDEFLEMAGSRDMHIMLTLQPQYIKDPAYQEKLSSELMVDFKAGVHWMHSQYEGTHFARGGTWYAMKPVLREFVHTIVSKYKDDARISFWDLYNEASKEDRGMVEFIFACAREINPSQPLTACWEATEISDVVSYHNYTQPGQESYGPTVLTFEEEMEYAMSQGRPVVCTECLARSFGNTFENFLPFYSRYKIGWYFWGLCAGSAQYHYPWGWPEGSPEPREWFHCILYPDGTPYRREEIELIRDFHYLE